MNHRPLALLLNTIVWLASPAIALAQQPVYKWTDASGRVHYGERKPENAEQVQALDIAPSPPSGPANADSTAEIARINALSEQMASDREAVEKARQEQALRNLELKNQQLQNNLLKQQLEQQQQSDDNSTIIGYPPPYYPTYPSYPYPPTYRPYPPGPPPRRPCEPWPACRQPPPEPSPRPRPPLAKPNPPFNPAPAGLAPQSRGVFRGR
ncbi:MAG: DUF4124 domain-containing protein [Candidatus Competibacteraceae bacterium]|nr:MAG: DUF4124 domain-containing protein [Candidatus Competibacteraceae bacterium]